MSLSPTKYSLKHIIVSEVTLKSKSVEICWFAKSLFILIKEPRNNGSILARFCAVEVNLINFHTMMDAETCFVMNTMWKKRIHVSYKFNPDVIK